MTTTKKPRRSAKKPKTAKKAKKAAKKPKPEKVEDQFAGKPSVDEITAKILKRRPDMPAVIFEDHKEEIYPTRFRMLNHQLGGGLIAGTVVELAGWEDSGKTSTAIALMADVQAEAKKRHPGKDLIVLVNYERAYDYRWWKMLGLDTSKYHFVHLRPANLEEGIADLNAYLDTGRVIGVLIDSVKAANSKDGDKVIEQWADPKKSVHGGQGIGVEARQWSKAWTALKGRFQDLGVVAVAVNQVRVKIDMGGAPKRGYSVPTTTGGGHALKFYAWVRLELKGGALVDEDKKLRTDVDGKAVVFKVIKNKTSGVSRAKVKVDLIRDFGFDLTADLLRAAFDAGAIKHKGGGNYVIGPKQIRGKAKLREWLETDEKAQRILGVYVDRWLAKQDPDALDFTDTDNEGDEPDDEQE